ncbi:MAG TPA: hypothetical protein VJU78_02570 [Chitinophagaceae bacterium]|nr:hypothetical protein [Chitinophagaceae bacterium]
MSQVVSLSTTPKKTLKGTMILFCSVVVSILIFMLIAFLIGQTKGPLIPALSKYKILFTWFMVALLIVCLLIAKRIFNKGITAAKNSLNPLNDKLSQHRSALIKYLVICEVPALLSVLLFLFTGDFIFQVYVAIFLGFMLAMTPVQRRVASELELDGLQQKELE